MTLEDFYKTIKEGGIRFLKLGSGAYNHAVVTSKRMSLDDSLAYWVVKIPNPDIETPFPVNNPSRAIRKWRAINPDIPAHVLGSDEFWIAPFLGKEHPSDEMINQAVIDIYVKTGNIIVDACISSNFVLFEDKPVCVDMDLAIHRDSVASEYYFNTTVACKKFDDFFIKSAPYNTPKTQATIKTLLYLEEELSDFNFDRNLLNERVVNLLHRFQIQKAPILYNTLELLNALLVHPFDDELLQPIFLNYLALQWKVEKPIEDLNSLYSQFRASQEPLNSVGVIPKHAFSGFFAGLEKRNSFTSVIERDISPAGP